MLAYRTANRPAHLDFLGLYLGFLSASILAYPKITQKVHPSESIKSCYSCCSFSNLRSARPRVGWKTFPPYGNIYCRAKKGRQGDWWVEVGYVHAPMNNKSPIFPVAGPVLHGTPHEYLPLENTCVLKWLAVIAALQPQQRPQGENWVSLWVITVFCSVFPVITFPSRKTYILILKSR